MKPAALFGKKNNSGQSLLELLIGIAILGISLGSAAVVVFSNQSIFLDKRLAAKAAALASEGAEAARSIYHRDWTHLVNGPHGLIFTGGEWHFSGSQDVTENFTRVIDISESEIGIKEIVSRVSWQTDPSRPLKTELTIRLTNWRGLFGNWNNPRTLGSIDLGPGNQATDLKVKNKIVYMASTAASGAKPDFFIIDATDGTQPFIVSSLHTGPGVNAVALSGSYAFVANKSDFSQLQVINVTDIASPFLAASYRLPNISDQALSIFIVGNYAYLGTDDDAIGQEFHIVDINNPANPVSIGSLEVGFDVNSIYVKDNYAYLGIDNALEFWVVDVSDPVNPVKVSQYDAAGTSGGKALDLAGSRLYAGRLLDSGANNHEFHILDYANPLNLVRLGSIDFSSTINDLIVKDYLAFFATSDSNNEFKVYNISDPNNIIFVSAFNFPQIATGIDYENNLVYVSVRSNDALRIITSQ